MLGGGVFQPVGPGQGTDDTELMLCLAQSLATSEPLSLPLNEIAQAYSDWASTGPLDIGESLITQQTMLTCLKRRYLQCFVILLGAVRVMNESAGNFQSFFSGLRIILMHAGSTCEKAFSRRLGDCHPQLSRAASSAAIAKQVPYLAQHNCSLLHQMHFEVP